MDLLARWDESSTMSPSPHGQKRSSKTLSLSELQGQVGRLVGRYRAQLEMSPTVAVLDLVSEMGEVAKAILEATDYGRSKGKHFARPQLEEELGDVLYSVILLANSVGIDLAVSLQATLRKIEHRIRTQGHAGSGQRSPHSR